MIPLNLIAQTCEDRVSLSWILSEIDAHHPRLILQRLNVEKVAAGKSEAGKMINPELEHFSVWGKEFGNVYAYQNESRLWFTLQLASKRKKGLEVWSKQYTMARQEEELLKQALLKDLWLNFFRLHQINEEISVKRTLISRLEKVLSGYKRRQFLSPDRKLEERIFIMVVDNFSLSLNQLERERLGILGFFREVTGFKCNITKFAAEEKRFNWPKLQDLKSLERLEPLSLKLAKSELEFTQSMSSLAEARKTPNLRLSPVIQNYVNQDVNNTMTGISFVFPLPVFDRNQSERLQSILELKFAEKNVEIVRSREDFYFEANLKRYSKGLNVLKEIDVIDESVKTFEQLGNAFSEGKISISNIVEFCRQLDEILHRYHFGESVLMKDLIEILEQRGILNKETLENLI